MTRLDEIRARLEAVTSGPLDAAAYKRFDAHAPDDLRLLLAVADVMPALEWLITAARVSGDDPVNVNAMPTGYVRAINAARDARRALDEPPATPCCGDPADCSGC